MDQKTTGGTRLQGTAGSGGRPPPHRGLPAQRRSRLRADTAGTYIKYNVWSCRLRKRAWPRPVFLRNDVRTYIYMFVCGGGRPHPTWGDWKLTRHPYIHLSIYLLTTRTPGPPRLHYGRRLRARAHRGSPPDRADPGGWVYICIYIFVYMYVYICVCGV